jgi:muconate cycloisomerase
MVDECVSTDHDLIQVICKRAATVVQTKIAKNGGIWYGRKLWHIADAAGMRIYPGNHPATSVATAAVAHLAAAWQGELLDGPFPVGIANSRAKTWPPNHPHGRQSRARSRRPGLGMTLDEDKLRKLRVDI